MAWVSIIGGATALGTAAIKANASQGGGSGFMGGLGQSQTDASSATYGTSIGDDGWSINFGSGTQLASPTKTTSDSYSKSMAETQPNPLTGMTQQLPGVPNSSGYYGAASGFDTQTLLLLAVGGFMLLRR